MISAVLVFITIICLFLGTLNEIFYGIAFMLLGMSIIVAIICGYAASSIFMPLLLGGTFFLMGAGFSVVVVLENQGVDTGSMRAISFCSGYLIVYYSMFIYRLYQIITCSKKVMGTYKGCNPYTSTKSQTLYAPIFCYTVGKKTYTLQSTSSYSARKIQKKYTCSEKYPIYVNVRKPWIFTDSKKLGYGDILFFIIGTATLLIIIMALKQ